jgi:hypothetical protein
VDFLASALAVKTRRENCKFNAIFFLSQSFGEGKKYRKKNFLHLSGKKGMEWRRK